MIIRPAQKEDAPAMGQVMVATYLAAHRDQMPDAAWTKRAEEWTPEVSADGWARSLRAIATDERPQDCIYVALDEGGELVGLAMGGPADTEDLPQTGAAYALYVSTRHQGQGLGRRLVQAVAADLAQEGMTALRIGCLAANAPVRGFYEPVAVSFACSACASSHPALLSCAMRRQRHSFSRFSSLLPRSRVARQP